jgi:hypothetical protein
LTGIRQHQPISRENPGLGKIVGVLRRRYRKPTMQ